MSSCGAQRKQVSDVQGGRSFGLLPACGDAPCRSASWRSSRSPPCTRNPSWTAAASWKCWRRLSLGVSRGQQRASNYLRFDNFTLQRFNRLSYLEGVAAGGRIFSCWLNLKKLHFCDCCSDFVPLLLLGNFFLSLFFRGTSFCNMSGTAT